MEVKLLTRGLNNISTGQGCRAELEEDFSKIPEFLLEL